MLVKDRLDKSWNHSNNVDDEEIKRFTAVAEEWWNPNGKFRVIHKFNPVRRDYIISCIADYYARDISGTSPFAGLKILDVGCGAGLLCEPLADLGASVVGIDATARNIEIARWHAVESELSIDYRHCLTEDIEQTGERFDVVLNTEVIEHVVNPHQLLADCSKLLKPNGIMIVATLNRTLKAYLLAIIGAEYVLKWLPKGTHEWKRFLSPSEIKNMIEPCGLETVSVTGVSFNLFSNRWRLSKDTSVNYMLLAAKKTDGDSEIRKY
jgi:2-polyprenyl-6-hydroxyphenyl methylase / 3-demethylubiquinone-9 3-methyltransferase